MAEVDYAWHGQWGEFTIALGGDLAMFISGPLAKIAQARQAYRLAKAAYYTSAAIQGTIAATRLGEAVYECARRTAANLPRERILARRSSMFGVRADLARAGKVPVAGAAAATPG